MVSDDKYRYEEQQEPLLHHLRPAIAARVDLRTPSAGTPSSAHVTPVGPSADPVR